MTQFGFTSSYASPARQRIEAAGRAYAERQQENARAEETQRRLADAQRKAILVQWVSEVDAANAARVAEQYLYSPPATRIVMSLAETHSIPVSDILGNIVVRDVTVVRHECFWRIRTELGWSYPRIAMMFNKDHSTVLYGCRKHAARMGKAA